MLAKFFSMSEKRAAYYKIKLKKIEPFVLPGFFLSLILSYFIALMSDFLAYLLLFLIFATTLCCVGLSLYMELWTSYHHFSKKED